MKRLSYLLIAFLTAPALLAEKQSPPPAAPPKPFTLPQVTRFELPNGMKVRMAQYGSIPKVGIAVVTQTGNADEASNEIWLADLVGDILQQGTVTRSAEELARQFAEMGGPLAVTVSENQTRFTSHVFSESGPQAVATIADVVRNPSLPQSELERLKTNWVRNLAIQRSQQQQLANEKFWSVLYPGQPYGRYFPTQEMLQGYTLEQVKGYYERNFGAARSAIYVVGRFDAGAMERAVRQSFSDWKRGNPPADINVAPAGGRKVYLVDKPGAVQSTLMIGLPTIDPSSPDYVALLVADSLLGGSFASRITSNIREQKGYTYSPFSTVNIRLHSGTWFEQADVTTNVTGPSIKEIFAEIDRLRAEAPPQEELTGIQNNMAGIFVLQNSSRQGIINQLAFLDLYGLAEDYLRNFVQRVFAVTPAEVQRIAKQYLDPSKMAIVVVGDTKVIAEQVQPYGQVVQ
jgi:predicted Zn-dependent peptidase